MNSVLFFLLTFGSCAERSDGLGIGPKYQGYEQTIDRGFVANYVYDRDSRTSKWLTYPVVFKLSAERDTMFMYVTGRGYVFPRIKDSMKCYSGFVGQNKIKFTIRESWVDAEMPGCHRLCIVNKSML